MATFWRESGSTFHQTHEHEVDVGGTVIFLIVIFSNAAGRTSKRSNRGEEHM